MVLHAHVVLHAQEVLHALGVPEALVVLETMSCPAWDGEALVLRLSAVVSRSVRHC